MTAEQPRRIHIIGIGVGSPGHLTRQATQAISEVDVFLAADKGGNADELVAMRQAIAQVHAKPGHQFLAVPDPKRGDDASRDLHQYEQGVRDWHAARTAAYVSVLQQLPQEAVVGFLVWGDPAFYDSTIRVVDAMGEYLPLEVNVTPGITAFQALAAAHRTVLHEVGQPVHITTGRRLVAEWRAIYGDGRASQRGAEDAVLPGLGTVVVMLDGRLSCQELMEDFPQVQIHWGAYVGMRYQEIRSGTLVRVLPEIVKLRETLRAQHGWIMDVYTLSQPQARPADPPVDQSAQSPANSSPAELPAESPAKPPADASPVEGLADPTPEPQVIASGENRED